MFTIVYQKHANASLTISTLAALSLVLRVRRKTKNQQNFVIYF